MQYTDFTVHITRRPFDNPSIFDNTNATNKIRAELVVRLNFGPTFQLEIFEPRFQALEQLSSCCGNKVGAQFTCEKCYDDYTLNGDYLWLDFFDAYCEAFIKEIFDLAEFDPLERVIYEGQLRDDFYSLRAASRSAWRSYRHEALAIEAEETSQTLDDLASDLLTKHLFAWQSNSRTRKSKRFTIVETPFENLFPNRVLNLR